MKKANFIIIFCDDLGYGDLGCYGSKINSTPNLDKMADEGIRFTDFYVPSSVCSPSRAALMTGCYPKRIGLESGYKYSVLMPGEPIGLNQEEFTLAKLLKTEGYATKAIGKWHLGDQPPFMPSCHGFDSYFGLPYSNDMLPDHPYNDRFNFPPLPLMREEEVCEIDPNQVSLTDRYTNEAVEFIQANRSGPFFLYLAHMYVHEPIYAPMKYLHKSQNGAYGAAVEHLDSSTGKILDTLKELEIDDNTLVIFTSDNGATGKGGGSNFPLKGTKATAWEGGHREPCIMRWPSHIKKGTICSEITTTMDFLPTFAVVAGASLPDNHIIDGKDISPLISSEENVKSQYDALFYYGQSNLYAVRSGKWKLFFHENLLYNLEIDIGESENVYNDNPDIVKKLNEFADKCRIDIGDTLAGIDGKNCREPGMVENPKTLTVLDADIERHKAEYD